MITALRRKRSSLCVGDLGGPGTRNHGDIQTVCRGETVKFFLLLALTWVLFLICKFR